ncbi:hypothetical protein F4692_001494 [Nocardioides cavernae]|uniref:Uncharacterized protein n=1 Tax=Nocardioides cavernae TaxID=1921566 RepID=A0A7Y9H217_9ACTN|nr:hypothetical protein [Nocardioides cavernae]NYE36390.1 hypothetical protein [Nocardioides cavernae]
MRNLTRRLAPHARASWVTFAAVASAVLVAAVLVVVLNGGDRPGVVATVATWFVAIVVLGAFLDAILVPGNPDVRRRAGHDAGWTGVGAAVGLPGGGSGGDAGGSCS